VASRQPFFTTGTILSRQRRYSIYDSGDTIYLCAVDSERMVISDRCTPIPMRLRTPE